MILNLSNDFICSYNKHVSKLILKFDKITKNDTEENIFLAISVALRIAAKLSKKYGFSKEAFMDAADGNYDLENNIEQKPISKIINKTDITLN